MLPKCLLIAIAALAITSVARPVDGNQALDNGGDLARRASGHYDTYSAAIEASTAVAVVEAREDVDQGSGDGEVRERDGSATATATANGKGRGRFNWYASYRPYATYASYGPDDEKVGGGDVKGEENVEIDSGVGARDSKEGDGAGLPDLCVGEGVGGDVV